VGSEVESTGNTVEWEERGQKARLHTGVIVCAHCQDDACASLATKGEPRKYHWNGHRLTPPCVTGQRNELHY
jgi:hypothetical protein